MNVKKTKKKFKENRPENYHVHDNVEQWCSFCNDFRDRLLLCAGCRVALCSADVGSTRGCVPWDVVTNWHFSSSFHFYVYLIDTLYYSFESSVHYKLTPCYPFHLLTLFQTIKENQKRVYSSPKT